MVNKVDLLFPEKKDSKPLSLEGTLIKEFLKEDEQNRLAKMALNKVLSDQTIVPKATFSGQNFAADLHVPLLVKEFLGTNYASPFVYKTLISAPIDVETILFRQEILKELEQEKAAQSLEDIYLRLTKIAKSYEEVISSGQGRGDMTGSYYYPNRGEEAQTFAAKITLLHNYLQALETIEETNFNSGLSRLKDYAQKVKEDRKFQEMSKYVRSFTDHLTLSANIEITFNHLGSMTRKKVMPVSIDRSHQILSSKISLLKLTPFYTKLLFDKVDDFIEDYFDEMLTLASYLGELEFYRGANSFVKKLEMFDVPCTYPQFEEGKVKIRNLHNPLLVLQEAKAQGFRSVANDVLFEPEKRLYVLTGPNDGGKSVYLRAIGLGILLAQNGYPIPAEKATLTTFDDIYTHFIPKDDIKNRRGRYRQELQQLRYIFEKATPKSLVLLDEPCGGTDPGQGSKQSLTTLRKLYRLGSSGVFATHMHNVAEEVQSGDYPFAHNLQVGVEIQQGKPLLNYKVSEGRSGQSYGDLIAKDIGVDDDSLDQLLEKRFPKKD